MDKLSKILAGESFPSTEIQALIQEIEKDHAEATETLEALKNSIEEKRLAALGGPVSKEIKNMETEAAELENVMATMVTALERLQEALTKALEAESADSIREINEKLVDLENQKQALLPEFFKAAAKAAALYHRVFGIGELRVSRNSGPMPFWDRKLQVEYFDSLEKFLDGQVIIPNEVSALQSRKRFLTRI